MKNGKLLYVIVSMILMYSATGMAVDLTISNIDPAGYTVQYDSLASSQLVYIDRTTMFFSDVPSAYQGKTYIQTANDDKYNTSNPFLTFTVDQNCTVYVAHDNRITTKPSWLSSFTDTNENISIGGNSHSLFKKDFNAGTVSLGGNAGDGTTSMYSVVVIPIYTTAPDPAESPSPANNATGVPPQEANLSWIAGASAASHNVYFGQSNPPTFIGNQIGATYNPGRLANDTTYYWQIDEINAIGTTTGTLWSFTTGLTTATGYWPMDDDADSSIVDDIANNFNGTFNDATGNPFTSAHHSTDRQEGSGSLIFDGIDDYVTIPRNSELETGHTTTHHLSASAWIKDESGGASGWGTLVGTGDGGWVLARNGSNGMLAGFWLTSGGLVTVSDSTNISDGEWHYVAVAYDGSAAHLYVDETHTTNPTTGGSIQNLNDNGVLIGENAGAAGRHWKGLIDNVKIYDYALSSEDVHNMQYPEDAWYPSPLNGAGITDVTSKLSWLAGQSALSHNVYFGTSESAVTNAQRLAGDISGDGPVDIVDLSILASQWLTNPGIVNLSADIEFSGKVDLGDLAAIAKTWHQTPDPIFKGNQSNTTYDPGTLTEGVTYYWRVDEVNPSEPDSPRMGRVWNFKPMLPIKIMPLGDSITQGWPGTNYRYYLWNQLVAAGYTNLDFVGSLALDDSGYDNNHEGHFGKTDDYIATYIYSWLQLNPADIVLLHIGTNGLEESPAGVENILDEIDRYESDYNHPIKVILAKIINRNFSVPTSEREMTTTFNNNVAAMAQARIDNDGDDIVIIDMENGAGMDYSADMYDELHPNASGYLKIANKWYEILQTILSAE